MVVPGVYADGDIETDLLVDAHREALRETSFVWTETENRTGRVANVTDSTTSYRTVRFANATRYYFDTNGRTDRYQGRRVYYPVYNEYADGEDVYVRALSTSWADYRYDRVTANGIRSRFVRSVTNSVKRYLPVGSVSIEQIESAAGSRYRLTSTVPSETLAPFVEDYRVSAVVTQRGLVRNLTATYTTERSTATDTITFTHRYSSTVSDVENVAVSPPAWLPAAQRHLANGTRLSSP
ncbi:hypothetical protein HLRTI_001543 [Halorhabdus tiamatea SARL4B]|uniref:Uncharacterized protein n=1 Tax=Halorhabdus tiamatea SARL4B TaxID=1033806 RepID=F7PM53_9EURY|nr:hypothetical protein [Halorhabdus tiamatea]ERJ06338.1 hypothetical protein HLRTI_001543 [Halorhabdus tiamatea SARL4B]CCQ34507.1 hypothetical protein HTIA_2399 [Halorhabdus tiamatea SARL4B]